ncbi:MAG: hypothetical protein ACI4C5_10430 [Lachnospiraceae bacterium]
MSKLCLLLRIRLDELFGVSVTKYEKNQKKKISKYIHGVTMLLLFAISVTVAYGVALKLAKNGFANLLPVTSYTVGSIISLVVTILKINEMLSGNEDAEFLMSMPFSTISQVVVLFLILYLKNTFYAMIAVVPMGIVYGMYTSVSGSFWALWILGLLLTSLPASGIAALIGMVIAIFLSTSKNSNLIQSLISMGIFTGITILILHTIARVGDLLLKETNQNNEGLCQKIIAEITGNYKLAAFYQNGIVEQNGAWVFLFVLISVIWYLFFVFFLSMSYQELILALKSPVNYQTYEFKKLEQQNLKKALYKKEVKQWLHSKSYMVKSMTGVILSLLLSAFVLIKGVKPLCWMFGVMEYLPKIIMCVPLVLCVFVGMSCTSYCSVSMEGKRHWITQTIPMEEKVTYSGKIWLNLTLTVPMVILSASMLSIAFSTKVWQTILFFTVPIIYAIASAWWGLWIDKKHANYSNQSENQIMHQGVSFLLGYLPEIILPILGILWIYMR